MARRRPISNRRLERWLRGESDLAGLLGLSADELEDLLWAGYRRLEAGAFADAERVFGLIATLRPDSAAALLGRGACLQARGALDEAEGAYGEVLDSEPENVHALANRAEVRLLTHRPGEARADLARARELLGSDGESKPLRERVEALWGRAQEAPS